MQTKCPPAAPLPCPSGTHANLFSNIAVGAGTRVFKSGGAKGRGAHSGAVGWSTS